MQTKRNQSICLASLGFFLFALAGASTIQAQSDGVALQWKWSKGDKLEVVSEQDISMSIKFGANEISTSSTTNSWSSWHIIDVGSEGHAKIKTVINRMKVESKSPQGDFSFDSADDNDSVDPDTEMLAGNIRPMIGAESIQSVAPNGAVSDVEIDADLTDSLMKMGGEATVAMFKKVSENASLAFPDNPLKMGESWERSMNTESPAGNVSVLTKYMYQGIETVDGKDLHKFDVDVEMAFESPIITVDEQSTNGSLFFDADAGHIDHSRVEQDMKMTISQGGQEAKQEMKQIAVIRMKKAQ